MPKTEQQAIEDTQNIQSSLEGDKLTIVIDLSQELYESGSGKSMIIATTSGNKPVAGRANILVGINVYKPVKRGKR